MELLEEQKLTEEGLEALEELKKYLSEEDIPMAIAFIKDTESDEHN